MPNIRGVAATYTDADSSWFLQNIPYFECSDKTIEQVYYYRWRMYKAHIRHVGTNEYVITEFINDVAWDRDPYSTINAASMHHIYEGRWLRNHAWVDAYEHYLIQEGGNNWHYSESIADAAWAKYLVTADSAMLVSTLDSLKATYAAWSDHYDSLRNLYWIPAMPDATEYTIASIDASVGTAGFDHGEAFRPTINSYMYANALAISKIARLKRDAATADQYAKMDDSLLFRIRRDLWNDSLKHFTDRFKQQNRFVRNWDFIRGRELAGFVPWYFDVPPDSAKYLAAWKHLTDTSQLLGRYGFRTEEPSYQYYFNQFVYLFGQRGSQWNGPSWPYQTSQVLTGMANTLNDYHQSVISAKDYVNDLRLFARQHFLPTGKLGLVEDYDPNLGGPIVYYYWSNHYNHSSFNNLVISGLCGIRPMSGDSVVIHPLIDSSITYFCLQDVDYHGHRLAVSYDATGERYHAGKGVSVWVDGKRVEADSVGVKAVYWVGPALPVHRSTETTDYALNITRTGFPRPSASVNNQPDSLLWQAIDGRCWYFLEITNYWSSRGSTSHDDWYALDFGAPKTIRQVNLAFVSDSIMHAAPDSVWFEYRSDTSWKRATMLKSSPEKPTAGTMNSFYLDSVSASMIRIHFHHSAKQVAVSEIECQ